MKSDVPSASDKQSTAGKKPKARTCGSIRENYFILLSTSFFLLLSSSADTRSTGKHGSPKSIDGRRIVQKESRKVPTGTDTDEERTRWSALSRHTPLCRLRTETRGATLCLRWTINPCRCHISSRHRKKINSAQMSVSGIIVGPDFTLIMEQHSA